MSQVQVVTWSGGRSDMQIITDYRLSHKTKHFRWWNVFDDMCRMYRWSFWSWFDV